MSFLQQKGLSVITIGNGDTIVDYYPKQKVVSNDRIILITNGQNKTMPNMKHWSKREVMYVLDYFKVKYTLTGNGYVKEQSIKEHTPITPELDVTVTFENKIKK